MARKHSHEIEKELAISCEQDNNEAWLGERTFFWAVKIENISLKKK